MFSAALVPESIEYHVGHLPVSILMTILVWFVIVFLSVLVAHFPRFIPAKMRMAAEVLFEYVCTLAKDLIGPQAPKFYPLFLGLFIFILVANLVGLIPGLISPTADPALTFGLALMVFLYFNFLGLKEHGFSYFKQFLGPKLPWFMAPVSVLFALIEIISLFMRPFSLGLRLFCNIFSKELFLGILALLVIQFFTSDVLQERLLTAGPLLLRPFILLLGLLVGLIQALVFTILSMSYIAGAVQAQEHH
ncbi:MAG: ATP synthase F0 subunit A [Candidatus Raymondbacteria bacterium RifOxyA12_full_50_37]|uniref:ATP synthase subunit a n=1 Tax=Candidatus Raymondbacteria bacterium RIFOXYD12_FULL_49_13 TaxID=1817890 RepID=A0A1F7F5H3_UNCRA|nr:MAG: ATP synthase F0 subunit A [Candidatus Raymondbacteria bacterium RifOxyA12_full_50_37]OGJ89234.1 MAG: ATP synthase F0 subunit A [Candidatus Raymondbacteria bacterium RIFOXYA2_FULL_49_16]OGJ96478.1 MAG: ATP synthase F0 subunit A [Candidatus Raymondbacteria bacterium RifOxyC12_full_50_8]OGJ97400.1 MAG: ATP synthase F0 subunit A [Candidatus Raymondbacteria bacterium RIFOXYC2_FULL_50_21]OGK01915.1 MAG: ATP synthase F0 subunit A [Candidatus Raymondbacteria bacterium RIFOXYD12_FULL_49_13]OGP4